jgi:hypothetical protein
VFIIEKKKPIHKKQSVQSAINALPTEGRGSILSDVLGSYTGSPENGEVPEQDADDL